MLLALVAPLLAPTPHGALLDWIQKSAGGEVGPVTLASSAVGAGSGCFTTRDVQPGEVLFAIPDALCIGLDTAADFADIDDERERVAVYLAHRRLTKGEERGNPYLDSAILPWNAKDQEHVLWWTGTEIELLQGCTAYGRATEMHAEALRATDRCCPLLPDSSRAEVYDAIRGAFVSLYSRAFGYGDTWLVPVLDGLNHCGVDPNAFHSAEAVEQPAEEEVEEVEGDEAASADHPKCFVLRAKEPLSTGDEVTFTYGDAPDFEFACEYGFLDTGGMAAEEGGTPTEWTAAAIRRRASASARIEVAGLRFDISLRQLDYLRLMDAGLSLAAAAERAAGLTDLVSAAELGAFADGSDATAEAVLQGAAESRLGEIRRGRVAASAAEEEGARPGCVALAAAIRRSEELPLEVLVELMARSLARRAAAAK